jgi:hypothetical protein
VIAISTTGVGVAICVGDGVVVGVEIIGVVEGADSVGKGKIFWILEVASEDVTPELIEHFFAFSSHDKL